jgi:hypothetical protein
MESRVCIENLRADLAAERSVNIAAKAGRAVEVYVEKSANAATRKIAEALAEAMGQNPFRGYLHHSGMCCNLVNGKIVVTDESCRCEESVKRVRQALADLATRGDK